MATNLFAMHIGMTCLNSVQTDTTGRRLHHCVNIIDLIIKNWRKDNKAIGNSRMLKVNIIKEVIILLSIESSEFCWKFTCVIYIYVNNF